MKYYRVPLIQMEKFIEYSKKLVKTLCFARSGGTLASSKMIIFKKSRFTVSRFEFRYIQKIKFAKLIIFIAILKSMTKNLIKIYQ